MRVTQGMISAGSLGNVQAGLERIAKLQENLTSGKALNRPSDSPTGVTTALTVRSGINATNQYARNADDATAWLGTADSAMASAGDILQRVRNLTLQGASAGSADPAARSAIATEVKGLRDSLLGVANTTYLGRPVFGGTVDGTVAFAPSGTYVGDDGTVTRRLSDAVTVRVDSPGKAAFGEGATSVFAVLDAVASHLTDDPSALAADLGTLDTALSAVLTQRTAAGTRYARAENHQQVSQDTLLALQSTLSEVENIDLPATILELQLQQTAYQSALSATAKVLQPSLMDFLR
jgi:flagellar hook-associated protein 3 FlgL